MIARRDLLGGAAVVIVTAVPALRAAAQSQGRLPRVGMLASGLTAMFAPNAPMAHLRAAFDEGLQELGFVDGQNVTIDRLFAEGDTTKVSALVATTIARRTDVIVAFGPAVLKAAHDATRSVPIIAVDFETDPVAAGFANSLAHPGKNVTGVFLDQAELSGKWLEFISQVVPRLSRVSVM